MADAVVRYLVVDHHVPVYRIYRLGMGNAPREETTESSNSGTVVHVTLMHNSLAALNSPDWRFTNRRDAAVEPAALPPECCVAAPKLNKPHKSSHTTREPRQIGPSPEGPFFCY